MDIFFSEKSSAIFVFQTQQATLQSNYQTAKKDLDKQKEADKKNSPEPQTPLVKETSLDLAGKIIAWGEDNLYPQNVVALAEKNDIVPSTLKKKVELLVSAGYMIGQYEYQDGKKIFVEKQNEEIETFLEDTNINAFLQEAAQDLYWFINFFPQVVRDETIDKIIAVTIQEACHCRYGVPNKKGLIDTCYINANWDTDYNENSAYVIKNPVIDRYFRPSETLRMVKGSHFIYPLSFPSPNAKYYQLEPWHAAIKSKWLAYANQIPEYKMAFLNNEMSIKWQITISEEYFVAKFPLWNSADTTEEMKANWKKEVIKEVDDYLAGAKNAGKSIFVPGEFTEYGNDMRKHITFEDISSKVKSDGKYIEDGIDANSHLLYALGVPASLLGNSPDKNRMGGGGGSDIMASLKMYLYTCQSHADLILEVFNRLVFPYNGWKGWHIKLKSPEFPALQDIPPNDRNKVDKLVN